MPMPRARLAALGLASILAVAGHAHATNVCGVISASTSWTAANSPYVLTCDVVVTTGTLTIDPSVIVRFQPGTRLVAQGGTISATGGTGPAQRITFASVDVTNPGVGVVIQSGSGGTGAFTRCDFSNLQAGISYGCCGGNPGSVDNCTFTSCTTGLQGYTGVTLPVSNSTFTSCQTGADTADKAFTFCTFSNNVNGIGPYAERTSATNCTFTNNSGIAFGGSGNYSAVPVDRCTFTGNGVAVQHPSLLRRCSITGNQTGLKVSQQAPWECNDIYNNTVYNAEVLGGTTLNAANNWWGTTTTASIDARIRDGMDQLGLGFLTYTPILTGLQATTSTCACTTPTITFQPAAFSKFNGQTATFAITASATGTPSYQWKRNGVPLTNGGRFSGVTASTLVISPVAKSGSEPAWTDSGLYTCDVTNLCGTATASVSFTAMVCAADFNGAGGVNVQDIFDFLAAWFVGCP